MLLTVLTQPLTAGLNHFPGDLEYLLTTLVPDQFRRYRIELEILD